MVAALLYAGSDSVLSHATAAWWWGLIDQAPAVIEVSSRLRAASSRGVVVHRRRHLLATRHRRFPITTVAQTLLDFSADASLAAVRRALAQADFLGLLDVEAAESIAGRGKSGSVRLRVALGSHQPRLAHSRSELERAFLSVCEAAGLPLPELNVSVEGWTVDVVWRRERLVAELDGYGNHHTPAQLERDRRKDLELRAAGFIVLRYTWQQVTEQPELVVADLIAHLSARAA